MVDETSAAPALDPAAAWRASQYVRLGLDALRAVTLAEVRDPASGWPADWHAFEALVDQGCAPDVAFEILA